MGEFEDRINKIAELASVSKEEVQEVFELKKQETISQLSLTAEEALPIAMNKTRVFFKKRVNAKASAKEFVIFGQKADGMYWGLRQRDLIREYIKQNSKEAALNIGLIDEMGKYYYKTIDPKKPIPDWKDGKEVDESEYSAEFLLMDSTGNQYGFVVKSEKTEKLLAANIFSTALISFVPGKTNTTTLYETEEPLIKSKLEPADVKELLDKHCSEHLVNEKKLVELCKATNRKLVLLKDAVIMQLFLGKGDRSPALMLDINDSDIVSATAYFPRKTVLDVVEGVPVTILAMTGGFNAEKSSITLNGMSYYIEPKYRKKTQISKISELGKKDAENRIF